MKRKSQAEAWLFLLGHLKFKVNNCDKMEFAMHYCFWRLADDRKKKGTLAILDCVARSIFCLSAHLEKLIQLFTSYRDLRSMDLSDPVYFIFRAPDNEEYHYHL
jgi:hypothetical protein